MPFFCGDTKTAEAPGPITESVGTPRVPEEPIAVLPPAPVYKGHGPRTDLQKFANGDNVEDLFMLWDYDNSGFLEAKEIAVLMGQVDAEKVLQKMDFNKVDGKLDIDEFNAMLHECYDFLFKDTSGVRINELKKLIKDGKAIFLENQKRNIAHFKPHVKRCGAPIGVA